MKNLSGFYTKMVKFCTLINLWKAKLKMPRHVLLTGAILVLIIVFVPNVRNPVITLFCDNRTGFCEDTAREESVETNAKDQIQKRTKITKYQSGKTLWDWLGLLLVPVLLILLGYWFQHEDQRRAEQQANTEKDIANEYLRDEALQAYIDRMSELLLDRNLKDSKDYSSVRMVASTKTLTILRRLRGDGERKARVLYFLYDAGLLNIRETEPVINLINANFGGAFLSGVVLWEANLGNADLDEANLEGAILKGANLEGANLKGAYLKGTDLAEANLRGVNLEGADLEEAYLVGADLEEAYLVGVKNCTSDQIKAAQNWDKAYYSPDFQQKLGLPPEPSEADKS